MKRKIRSSEDIIVLIWLIITIVELFSADHRFNGSFYYPEKNIYSLIGSLIGSTLFLLFGLASITQAESRVVKWMWFFFVVTVSSIMALRIPIVWLPEWAAEIFRIIAFMSICASIFLRSMDRKELT